ncbi:MAG: DUF58 domain-containing protein [Gammaproteobacteria bacterium]|jgi:uncharacterized protein (DUF58 family)|nr:DUF58 domain-containing protein [Gammaproteobacteria bacterium]MBT4493721.1 DUF58 domain-containing protein [Gammaproteobacteria bacterium]MBT7370527.1 DUF58 domain-containing protein [Gammaproteobacteria bacterium]
MSTLSADTVSSEEILPELRRSERFNRWLDRRMPPANSISLDLRKIFILPTRQGIYFVLLVCAMVIAGINYQNSLVFALAFLLASLFMVGMLHTYRNLSGLTLVAGPARPAFAGDDAEFTIVLKRLGDRTYESLQVGWNPAFLALADLREGQEERVRCYVKAKKRGRLNPGRFLIQTTYPLGLFRAWSWVDLDMTTLVYPKSVLGGDLPSSESTGDEEGELVLRDGAEDFYGLREYQPGDSIRHIAWKAFARNESLMTKQYAAYADRRVWLEWDHFSGMDRESRLSRLCYWVLRLNSSNDEYGLRLPGVEIEPARGEPHREAVLKALALFEVD